MSATKSTPESSVKSAPKSALRVISSNTQADLDAYRSNRVPANTVKSTGTARNLYAAWRILKAGDGDDEDNTNFCPSELATATIEELVRDVPFFITEIRKSDRTHFKCSTLHNYWCGIFRILMERGINIIEDKEFKVVRDIFDGYLKVIQMEEPVKAKQASTITPEQESDLWERGFLNMQTPSGLQTLFLFLLAKYFALRGGEEIRGFDRTTVELIPLPNGLMRITFMERKSKTNQGGYKKSKKKRKVVVHIEDPTVKYSFTKVYGAYLNSLPLSEDIGTELFFRPLKSFLANGVGFSISRKVGKDSLAACTVCKGTDG